MDDVLLTSLSKIPAVGSRRARTIAEKFPTIESLRAASVEEIDALPGFGRALAKRVKDFAEGTTPQDENLLEVTPPERTTPAEGSASAPEKELEAPRPEPERELTTLTTPEVKDPAGQASPPAISIGVVAPAEATNVIVASSPEVKDLAGQPAPSKEEENTRGSASEPNGELGEVASTNVAGAEATPPTDDLLLKIEAELSHCPECGFRIGQRVLPCSFCNPFAEAPGGRDTISISDTPLSSEGALPLRDESLNACPKCGTPIGDGKGCTKCAVLPEPEPTSVAPLVVSEPAKSVASLRPSEKGALEAEATFPPVPELPLLVENLVEPHSAKEQGLLTGGVNGRVNWLAKGVVSVEGMVNGLVNGNGITNGRRARGMPPPPRELRERTRALGGITAIVLAMLIVPALLMLLVTPDPPGGIAIDGQFADWARVPLYIDAPGDALPTLDLVAYRVRPLDALLLVYAKANDYLWRVVGGDTESVFVFIDEDGDRSTGFEIGGLGADRAAEFYGWDGGLAGSQLWAYDEAIGPASDDWRSLRAIGSPDVASARDQLEARILLGPRYDVDRVRILFHTWSTLGEGDASDAVVGSATGALGVTQRTIASEIIVGTEEPFVAFTMRPLASALRVASVTVRQYGSLPPNTVHGSLFLDRSGNGVIDATDPLVSSVPFTGDGTFAINRTLELPESYILRADFLAPSPSASVGFRVVAAALDGGAAVPVTLTDSTLSMSYVTAPPASPTIDGAFADWNRYPTRTDADDDVQSVTQTTEVNENLDVRAHEVIVGTNVSVYLRVDGRILGGVDVPNFRSRTVPRPPTVDSDGDTVPDHVEASLGPTLPYDFNNDNVSDKAQSPDVDQDGVPDYNRCPVQDCSAYTDYVLEGTIPSWYPSPYAGQPARRYIGPVSLPPQRGVDTAIMYLDRDNRTDTGLLLHMDGIPFGVDYAYQAVGRGGSIVEAGLYVHDPSREIPWAKIADVTTAVDAHRLEAAFDLALVNLTSNHTFTFTTTDWRFNSDTAAPTGSGRAPGPETRTGTDPRILDIGGNQKLYLRDTNHATETACTTNKVASPTQGSGPAVSLTVGTGQSSCWYADSTQGVTIPPGDWETLLDVFLRHGIAVHGELITSNPRYREWNGGSFGAEGSGNPTGLLSNFQWVVVASSPTSPEKVVGILADDSFLYVQTWNGATWTSNWNTDLGRDQTRGFDIAYEDVTGDVVVAFGDGTTQLKYRKRVGGTWDGANVNAGSPLSDTPFWVRLSANPTNNDIMAAVATNSNRLHALRWDGAANVWGNQIQMTDLLAEKDMEDFDVAYERAPGHAFVIWGNDANELMVREFTGAWGTETTAYSFPDNVRWVTAAGDPGATSSRIAVGLILNDGNFQFGAWTGATWVARPAAVSARVNNERGMDVGFEATTNRAVFVFNTNSNPTQMSWRTWTEAGGFGSVTVAPGTTSNVNFIQVRPNSVNNDIMVLYADTSSNLFHRRWDGAAWSPLGGALETSLSENSQREPFMFAWSRVVEYDVYLEIWRTSSNSVSETIGSCLNQRVYGNDVQCLVTGVGSKNLNSNEVVRVRIAHSSLGGSFGLSFDAPVAAGDSRATIPAVAGIPEFEALAVPILAVLVGVGLRRRSSTRRRTSRSPP